MHSGEHSRGGVRRFDLAVQRQHLVVFSAAFLTAIIGAALGVFPLDFRLTALTWGTACAGALLLHMLYARGVSRRILNPTWVVLNPIYVTIGIHASGGLESPGFLWYIAAASAASFAVGRRAAYGVTLLNTVLYLGMLIVTGEVAIGDHGFLTALARMIFLGGSSAFFIAGIANLQDKRLRIRQLEGEAKRQVEELRRLAAELAAASERSQESDRLKSRFLANMSHELRTPMNSIIGFSEILLDRLDGKIDPKHLGFLRHINTSGQHLLGIINGVLDLSKVEAGKMEIYPEWFPPRQVIESVCAEMRPGASARQLDLHIEPDMPQIEADLQKFRQVLLNLLSNAVKFSPADAPIRVEASIERQSEERGTFRVSVTDRGIGIAPEHHDVIFQEFRQVDSTARREFPGTGLGLAIVRKLVELQGGRVLVESALGAGATFTIEIPVRTAFSRVPALEPPIVPDHVLVVEDDAHAYDLIAPAISAAGFVPLRARHGEDAIRIARDTKPLAITLDLVLPGIDGWEVLKRLKSEPATWDIPVVIVSRVDHPDLGVALGAEDYFVKPVDRRKLIERISQITRKARPRLLLIDDDRSVHELLGAELNEYSMKSAYDGPEGIEAARSQAPDIIILDLIMPGMTGFEVAESLKDDPRTADIPILLLTAKEISAVERRELDSRVHGFVQKGKSAREQLEREIRRVGRRRPSAAHPA